MATRSVPTRSQARERRAQEREGWWMELPKTGGFAHIRRLSALDKVSIMGLPAKMQDLVLAAFVDIATGGEQARTPEQWQRNIDRIERIANTLCVASFIEPRLVMTETELPEGDDSVLVVTDLHIDERMAVYNMVAENATGLEVAAKLAPFRDPPVGAVVAVPTLSSNGLSAERLARDESRWRTNEEPAGL